MMMGDEENALEAVEAEVETQDPPEAEPEAPEADAPEDVEQRARILGWKPPEEWRGDKPARGLMSAEQWVEKFGNTPHEIEAIKADRERERREFNERLERIEAANKAALERQRKMLEAKMDSAAESADFDGYKQAKAELEGLRDKPEPQAQPEGPPPETQAWMARNTWFGKDRVKTAAAQALAAEAMERGITDFAAQLEYVDREIEARMGSSKPRGRAAVDEGGLQPPRKRGKGASDLPAEAKKAAEMFVKDGIYKSVDEYAQDYWKMGGGNV